jgi:nitroreductase
MSDISSRVPEAEVDSIFIERWSPRAFSEKPVPEDALASLFEAARWAPSCYNEQPWLFLYADRVEELKIFRPLLVDANRAWADHAPVLAFALARRKFARNGKTSDWAAFDAGAAWMSLALQARRLGLCTHAMAGIRKNEAYAVLGVPRDDYEIVCAVAVGYMGGKDALPAEIREREMPSTRKSLAEVARRGKF